MDPNDDGGQDNELLIPFLSLVREIAADAAAQSDPDACLRHLRSGLVRLGFKRAGIWLVDPDDSSQARGTWGTGWGGEELDEHHLTLPIDGQFSHSFVETSHRVYLSRVGLPIDTSVQPAFSVQHLIGAPNQAGITLRVDGITLGIIGVDMLPTDQTIDADQVAALELLADVAAVSIARRRVIDDIRVTNDQLRATIAASRESEDRYRTVSELGSAYTYVLRVEPDGTLLTEEITDSVEKVTGYTPTEVIHDRDPPKIVHPDDQARLDSNTRQVLAGETTTIEYRIMTKSGDLRWLRLHRQPGWDEAKLRVTRIYAVTEDITEAKRAEEALEQREQSFRLLFNGNPHPMWVYDLRDFRFLAANDAAIENYGYSRDEFLEMGVPDLVIPEEVPFVAPVIAEVERLGQSAGRWRHRRKNGTIIEAQVASHALDFGGREAAIGIAFDVTEQVSVAEALRESEERFRFMAEATGNALYRVRFDADAYDYMSPAAEQLTGYLAAEINPAIWRRIIRRRVTPEGETLTEESANLQRHVGDELRYRRYYLISTKSGAERWIEDRSEPWRDQDGKLIGWAGVLSDITERQILEEQLRQSQKMEAIGLLAGGVAHDFNNLLTVIGGYAQLLLVQLDSGSNEYAEVEQIAQASQSAAALTRQLLAFSRRQVIAPRETNLNAIVELVSIMLRRLISEDITLRTELASQLDLVRVDPSQIEQVLMILASNARDAMPGGGTLAIQTGNVALTEQHVRYRADAQVGPHVMLTVSDSGRGIDDATRSHLFEPFFTTKEFGHGTGMSLAAVYGIVRQSGGSIEVVSEPGEGTTFKIYFPRLDAATPGGMLT